MSLTIQLPLTTEHHLRENATREGMPLESYISQLLTATSFSTTTGNKKKSATENELLHHIQLDIQQDDLREYHRLKMVFTSGTINDEERASLIQLNDLMEIAHAKRMEYVFQLAKLRKVSIEKLMTDLGIKHFSV